MMRFSDAVRIGSMATPQVFGTFRSNGGTCALGAAFEAIGGRIGAWPPEWESFIRVATATCPICEVTRSTTATVNAGGAIVVHLNDDHRWTRQQIADWIEGVERTLTPDAFQPVGCGAFACQS